MNLIKELNEALELEIQELNEETITYSENCMMILESTAAATCETAVCFLTKLATDIKNGTLSASNRKDKNRFAILATLSLLRKKQAHQNAALETPSIRKYLTSKHDASTEDLDEVQKIMLRILGKLKDDKMTGAKYRDHLVELYKSAPSDLHDMVVKLKRRYQQMKTKV
jgi:hypothetical protein